MQRLERCAQKAWGFKSLSEHHLKTFPVRAWVCFFPFQIKQRLRLLRQLPDAQLTCSLPLHPHQRPSTKTHTVTSRA